MPPWRLEESVTVTVFNTRISILRNRSSSDSACGFAEVGRRLGADEMHQSRAILADERTTSIAKTMSATLDGIIGHSTVMQELTTLVLKVAPHDCTVLIG